MIEVDYSCGVCDGMHPLGMDCPKLVEKLLPAPAPVPAHPGLREAVGRELHESFLRPCTKLNGCSSLSFDRLSEDTYQLLLAVVDRVLSLVQAHPGRGGGQPYRDAITLHADGIEVNMETLEKASRDDGGYMDGGRMPKPTDQSPVTHTLPTVEAPSPRGGRWTWKPSRPP